MGTPALTEAIQAETQQDRRHQQQIELAGAVPDKRKPSDMDPVGNRGVELACEAWMITKPSRTIKNRTA